MLCVRELSLQTVVRQCRQQDVAFLERHVPTGRNRYHEARYGRQGEGLGIFLIAYLDEVPVGSGEVLWEGSFPGCPEINGLACRS